MKKKNYLLLLGFYFFCSCSSNTTSSDSRVVIRLLSDPENLSPVNHSNVQALQIINLVFQSLLTVDIADKSLLPLLLKELPQIHQSDTLSVFSMELRESATWENGSPILAQDVALSLKLLKSPIHDNQNNQSQFDFIKDIKIDADNERRFSLVCTPYSPEMDLLVGDFFIVPGYIFDPDSLLYHIPLHTFSFAPQSLSARPEVVAHAGFFNADRFTRNPDYLRGSGEYRLADWKTGQSVTLERKKDWWGYQTNGLAAASEDRPSSLSFQILPDNNSAVLALENRQLDIFVNIPAKDFKRLSQQPSFREDYALHTPETYDFAFVGINSRLEKFGDAKTRQALAHLFDVPNIIRATQDGFATPTVGPISPADTRFYHPTLPPYPYAPATAEKLLGEAGWVRQSDGWYAKGQKEAAPLAVSVSYRAGNTVFENTALIFQQAAAAIGIPVRVVPLEASQQNAQLKTHEFELTIRSITGSPFTHDFEPIFHTKSAGMGGMNFTGFGTPESDRLIEAISRTQQEKEKARLLRRLQEILHEECTIVFLYFNKNRIAVRNRFDGVKVSGIKPGYDVSALTLKH